ncbi:MAG: hypothetical protein JXB48_03480 [Candidatus Latescibacteria bacterium]|nr:hypothetical protein [Candidatus Latescibacterota bacterium]
MKKNPHTRLNVLTDSNQSYANTHTPDKTGKDTTMGDMELGMIFDGRAGDPNIVDEGTRKKIAAFIGDRVGEFRCPDHNKAPTIVVTGDNLENISFDVTGCCAKCIQMTREKLAE